MATLPKPNGIQVIGLFGNTTNLLAIHEPQLVIVGVFLYLPVITRKYWIYYAFKYDLYDLYQAHATLRD